MGASSSEATPRRSGLPIDDAIPALRQALAAERNVVLQAPPGAGKSTVVPLELLAEPWARDKRLLLLEPRRLAARAVAQRMAATLGEPVGRTVGYRMRFETRVSRDTRIEVITEGVLTRMLQADPALEGTAMVLLDEFHERSVQADLALALALDAQSTVAPDLRLLAMSATMDALRVAEVLGGAAPVRAAGRSFDVETRFIGRGAAVLPQSSARAPEAGESAERLAAQGVLRALREEPGDILVFLPGAREIRRVQSLLGEARLDSSIRVLPLYGDLAASEQDAALAPSAPATRKVILSTDIAETSLTVEGVRVVVDCGLARRSIFDPVTGMSRLATRRVSRASARQRQGRAGRVAPGVCYRLWSAAAHRSLAPYCAPEIVETDLASLALELAAWGVREAAELRWLDPPPPAMLASARDLLRALGALDNEGRITAHGREMTRIGAHPRLAHLLLESRSMGAVDAAARLAALLSERDVLPRAGQVRDADVRARLELLAGYSKSVHRDDWAAERVRRAARMLARQTDASAQSTGTAHGGSTAASHAGTRRAGAGAPRMAIGDADNIGILLATAYPDRVGLKREGCAGAYLLANGRGASFQGPQSLARHELIVALDLDGGERDARILVAAPLDRAEFERYFADRLERSRSIEWSEREQAVVAHETVRFGALALSSKPLRDVPAEAARAVMLDGVRRMGLECLPWTRDARDLQARARLVSGSAETAASGLEAGELDAARAGREAPWPDLSDAALLATLELWLAPWLDGVNRREHLARVPIGDALLALLSWEQRRQLDALVPTHLSVPSGSRLRVDYQDESAPAVAVRLQELFGLTQTPRLGGGRIPVTLKLLSPAQRPVQITRDLASFWRNAYPEVRKDLRGRYPRHYWPENPLEAEPTRRAKPRR
jgi:ATP-dependent RNA helicase HrpB